MDADPALAVETAEGVYPPSEDSYLLLRAVAVRPGERFLEVGTGSGLVAIHAAKRARVVATDANPAAAALARRNARRNGVSIEVVVCDLFHGLRGRFDAIAFNPPYLAEQIGGDPEARAWQGGEEGDEVVLRFLAQVPEHLAPQGRIYLLCPKVRTRAIGAARERFAVRVVAEKPLFFESLQVLELARPTAGP